MSRTVYTCFFASQTLGFVMLGGVQIHGLNVTGLVINTAGGVWYSYAKYQQRKSKAPKRVSDVETYRKWNCRKVAYGLLTGAFYCCFLLLFSSNMAISALMDNDIGILKQVWSTNISKFTRMIQMFQIKQSTICRLTSASVWYICLLLNTKEK